MMDYAVEYTISEVSEITGYAPHVLRYYEKEFEINVSRNDSNHRFYTYKEIELIQYIKLLQEKGFSNKQIKLIISSPELVMSTGSNNSLDTIENSISDIDTSSLAVEISDTLEERFFTKLQEIISESNKDSISIIKELKDEIIALRLEINSSERDVLICENAKLKMKLQEKIYESIEQKEKIKKFEEHQIGFFKRLFRINNIK